MTNFLKKLLAFCFPTEEITLRETQPIAIRNQWRKPLRSPLAGLYSEYKFFCVTSGEGTDADPYRGMELILFPKDQSWEFHGNITFTMPDVVCGPNTPVAYHEEIIGMCNLIQKQVNKKTSSVVAQIKEYYDKVLQPSCEDIPLTQYYDKGIAYIAVSEYVTNKKPNWSKVSAKADTEPL